MNILCSAKSCPVILSSACVFYEGENLVYSGINTNDSVQLALQKLDASISGRVDNVYATAPLYSTGGNNPILSITQSSASVNGYLSSTDWNIFNDKQDALVFGNLTEVTSSILTITGGVGSVIGSGTSIQVKQASSSQNGFLSSADWSTFNNKQNAITLTTVGSTGASTFNGTTGALNIPDYSGGFSGFVPYTGATSDVDLGEHELKAGQVEFDQSPTGTVGVGVMRWNNTDGTLDLGLKGGNVTLQIGQEEVQRVVNKSGGDLLESAYQVVKVTSAQGQRLAVDLAQGDSDANSADTIGIVTETINNNQEGFITTSGLVNEINTTGSLQGETWVDGDILYLSPTVAGKITNIKPVAPNHTVILGYVVYAHANHGKIFVKCDNGYEIGELHNCYLPSPSNNSGIFWNALTSRYENNSIAGILGYTPVSTLRTLTINGTTYDLSANRSWTVGTITSITAGTGLTGGTITTSGTIAFDTTWGDARYQLAGSYVPTNRTLTINGTTYDLTANRSWSVGTVTSVSGTGTVSGLTLSGTVTSSGSLTLGGTLALTSLDITTGLGYTPYDAANPSGFVNYNIYTNNGTLTSDRTIGTASGYTLTIDPKTIFTNTVSITSATDSFFYFKNSGIDKWRLGNIYSAGSNYLQLYDENSAVTRLRWDNTGSAQFQGYFDFLSGSTNDVATFRAAQANVIIKATGATNPVSLTFDPAANYQSVIRAINSGGFLRLETNSITRQQINNDGKTSINSTPVISVSDGWYSVNTQAISTIPAATSFGNLGYVMGSVAGLNLMTYSGSATFAQANVAASILGLNSFTFSAGSSTITMTQASGGGIRAYSGLTAQNQFLGSQSGTITHLAGIQSLGLYNNSTGIITPVVTNYYGLLLNSSTEYGHTLTITNKWGIYQAGSDDVNYFAGKLINTYKYNRQTASYQLVIDDRSKLVEMNVAGANNLTVPLNSTVPFEIGTQIEITQYGAGQTTVVATGGVTIRSAGGALKLAAQYSGASLVKIGTDEWYLFGDITV